MVTRPVIASPVRRWRASLLGAVALACAGSPLRAQDGTSGEWRVNGGDSGYTRYAPLDQISADTVHDLEIVWRRPAVDATLHTRWPDLRYSNNLRSTPVMVGGVLYASNGVGLVEAFDPASGETLWVQETPFRGDETPRGAPNRGVGYWEDEGGAARRILSVRPPYLLAIDVETGRLIQDFGDAGTVDLRVYADTPELVDYSWRSPPLVVRDVVIVGSAMADHPLTKEQRPGYVRAYDVRTGEPPMDLESDSAGRRARCRDLARRLLGILRDGERLDHDERRRRARARLSADRRADQRHVRRAQAGEQPVRQ